MLITSIICDKKISSIWCLAFTLYLQGPPGPHKAAAVYASEYSNIVSMHVRKIVFLMRHLPGLFTKSPDTPLQVPKKPSLSFVLNLIKEDRIS